MTLSGLSYHELTSYSRGGMPPHFLDWEHQPEVFKTYKDAKPIPLPRRIVIDPGLDLDRVLKKYPDFPPPQITVQGLSSILLLTCTVTAKAAHSGRPFYFRSVASAGALYPFELYMYTQGIEGLKDGLYHYDIQRHALCPLRKISPADAAPGLNFFLTSIFFRSAWKYRDRAYRYCLLDTGHLLENLMLSVRSHGFKLRVFYDYDDHLVNSFLGLDPEKEASLAVCSTLHDESQHLVPARHTWNELPDKAQEASNVSGREVKYETIIQIHTSTLHPMKRYNGSARMDNLLGLVTRDEMKIKELPSWPGNLSYSEAVFSRRSRRNFINQPMTRSQFDSVLDALCVDRAPASGFCPISVALITEKINSLSRGFYLLDREVRTLRIVRKGRLLENMASICLDQAWLANASLHILFVSNLRVLDETMGSRGYRHAMLEAGRIGQLIYLLATSMELGCCGIGAFYDDEATRILDLNESSKPLYLVALGPVKAIK